MVRETAGVECSPGLGFDRAACRFRTVLAVSEITWKQHARLQRWYAPVFLGHDAEMPKARLIAPAPEDQDR